MAARNEAVIETENLAKAFGDVRAVDGISLTVHRGELFGLVGPDGAGKTTTMRLLAGIMEATAGTASVAGFCLEKDPEGVKEKIGYMSQRFGLYEDLTVMENIGFYADLYDVPTKERAGRVERLLGFSNLTPFKARLAGNLSGGMKQKLGLACALIHTPEVLFLDEPTSGVDPVSRRDFWRILYDLLRENITVFVSTAYLDEAERCTRIALMHRGRILISGTPDEVKLSLPIPMVEITSSDARAAAKVLAGREGVRSVNVYGERLHVGFDSADLRGSLRAWLEKEGLELVTEREITPSLEDVFISMVGKAEGNGGAGGIRNG